MLYSNIIFNVYLIVFQLSSTVARDLFKLFDRRKPSMVAEPNELVLSFSMVCVCPCCPSFLSLIVFHCLYYSLVTSSILSTNASVLTLSKREDT